MERLGLLTRLLLHATSSLPPVLSHLFLRALRLMVSIFWSSNGSLIFECGCRDILITVSEDVENVDVFALKWSILNFVFLPMGCNNQWLLTFTTQVVLLTIP